MLLLLIPSIWLSVLTCVVAVCRVAAYDQESVLSAEPVAPSYS
jgi:hypothetical protein